MDTLDARKLPIYYTVKISATEIYTVDYINTNNGITKAWKKINPMSELIEEKYITEDNNPLYILESIISKPKDVKPVKKNNYQQFIKDKREEYNKLHPNMTKKERYMLILEEWKKTKD